MQVRREMEAEAGGEVTLPALPAFDSNVVTPGTPFMARLADVLREFLSHKVAEDPDWSHLQVPTSMLHKCNACIAGELTT